MFMVVLVVLALIGLTTVLGGAGAAGVAGLGLVGLAAVVMFKVLFFLMLFAFVGRMLWHGGPRYRPQAPYPRRSRRRPAEPQPSPEERFEDWHRLAHAREEVDSWVADLDGGRPQ